MLRHDPLATGEQRERLDIINRGAEHLLSRTSGIRHA
jgi:hypothetical protein